VAYEVTLECAPALAVLSDDEDPAVREAAALLMADLREHKTEK
jgi:hypothetical protein